LVKPKYRRIGEGAGDGKHRKYAKSEKTKYEMAATGWGGVFCRLYFSRRIRGRDVL
jgi:hypothetical protein